MSGSCVEKEATSSLLYALALTVHANVTQMREGRVCSELSSSFLNSRVGHALQSKLGKVLKCTMLAPKFALPTNETMQ